MGSRSSFRKVQPGRAQPAAPRRRRAAVVETLERRQMLSVTLDAGVARITGTPGDDSITVSRDKSNRSLLRVSVNGFLNALDESALKLIQIQGGDGNDRITVDQSEGSIFTRFDIAGGLGNDTITAGAGNDHVSGGRGNDVIRGGAGNDRLEGGISNDVIYGGLGSDNLAGGAGADTLYSGGEKADSLSTGNNPGDKVDTTTPQFKPGRPQGAPVKPFAVNNTPVGLTPQQIRTAYGFGDLSDAAFTNRGAGQTIAIVVAYDYPTARNDLNVFSTQFGLPTVGKKQFGVVYADGVKPQFDEGWAGEAALDVQWVHAIAPEARILLVEAASAYTPDMYLAVDRAIELLKPTGGVVSMSFGLNELFSDGTLEAHFAPEGVNNISFVAATGDLGAEVNYPAVSGHVLAVGGTNLQVDASGNRTGPETGWSGSGGGLSDYYPRPSFQSGLTLAGGAIGDRRGVPDVSYNADPATGVALYTSFPDFFGDSGWATGGVGGTSAGSPQWAGLVALANQRRAELGKAPIGDALTTAIYDIARTDYANNFNDITSGNNGFPALAGWDLVTGWGTPKADALIDSLAADNSVAGGNLLFEAARLLQQPPEPGRPTPQMFFGGSGFADLDEGTGDYTVEVIPNASSGVSFSFPGPLTRDANGEYSGVALMETIVDITHTLTHQVRFVGHIERRHRRDVLVGEFYAVSSRGKILYQGDKPVFYGTFVA